TWTSRGGIWGAVAGVLAGTILTHVVLAVGLMSPLGRRYHWEQTINRYTGENDARTHSLLALQSRHLHMVREITCSVETPAGTIATPPWRAHIAAPRVIPKAGGPTLPYPSAFAPAAWPTPGQYTVTGKMTPQAGGEPIVAFRSRWPVG